MIRAEEIDDCDPLTALPACEDRTPGNARVLLVEDDPSLRRYLEVVLQRKGYEVLVAADGLEAMKVTLTAPLDVVVTDAVMPNLNGYELCRFVKNSPTLAQTPVVLLSALEQNTSCSEDAGIDAYLAKPISIEDLTDCIQNLLRHRAQA
jgi:DNA-binding response OmpR family regulator